MVQLSNIARKVVVNIKGLDTENEVLSEEIKTIERRFKRFKSSVLLRADDEFRDGSAYVVSDDDVGIIQALLEAGSAPAGAKNPIWMLLQGRLCEENSKKELVLEAWKRIEPLVRNAEASEPTKAEWLVMFSMAIGLNRAKYELAVEKMMDDFETLVSAIDTDGIGTGDVIADRDDGRHFVIRGRKPEVDIEGKTVREIAEGLTSASDFYKAALQMVAILHDAAMEKAEWNASQHAKIMKCAKDVNPEEIKKARDMTELRSEESSTMASTYLVPQQRVHDFLENNKDVLDRIAEQNGVEPEEILDWLDNKAK